MIIWCTKTKMTKFCTSATAFATTFTLIRILCQRKTSRSCHTISSSIFIGSMEEMIFGGKQYSRVRSETHTSSPVLCHLQNQKLSGSGRRYRRLEKPKKRIHMTNSQVRAKCSHQFKNLWGLLKYPRLSSCQRLNQVKSSWIKFGGKVQPNLKSSGLIVGCWKSTKLRFF